MQFTISNYKLKIFRTFERGQIGDGDIFCVSNKDPRLSEGNWKLHKMFSSKWIVRKNWNSDALFNGVDDLRGGIADIDPVEGLFFSLFTFFFGLLLHFNNIS